MWQSLSIVALVGLSMATGVALAAPARETRLPVTLSQSQETSPESQSEDVVVVAKGDHLWKVSSRHLEAHSPGLDVAPYWLRVIETNQPTLRSGDPDLIYPGELIRLPELIERP